MVTPRQRIKSPGYEAYKVTRANYFVISRDGYKVTTDNYSVRRRQTMSLPKTSKVLTIRLPTIYFYRLSYLSHHLGRLPSEVAREALIVYLNLGCPVCGGPITDLEDIGGSDLATCINPDCDLRSEGKETQVPIADYSDTVVKHDLPGFSI